MAKVLGEVTSTNAERGWKRGFNLKCYQENGVNSDYHWSDETKRISPLYESIEGAIGWLDGYIFATEGKTERDYSSEITDYLK